MNIIPSNLLIAITCFKLYSQQLANNNTMTGYSYLIEAMHLAVYESLLPGLKIQIPVAQAKTCSWASPTIGIPLLIRLVECNKVNK